MASPSLLKLAPRLQAGVRNSPSRWSAAKTETSKVGITPISQNKHRGCSRVGYDFAEGELDPKVCFIEIGAVGSSIDQATADRVQAAAVQATHDTGKPKAKMPPMVKRSFFASYVDDISGYTIQKPRHAPQTYWVASNHLFSPAAVTNSSAQVVSRYTYDTYGKQTIRNGAGTIVSEDVSLMGRGFTGYSQCSEIGSYYARARMYSPRLGRFVNRDPMGYVDGYSLYNAFFAPNKTDSTGMSCDLCGPDVTVQVRKVLAAVVRYYNDLSAGDKVKLIDDVFSFDAAGAWDIFDLAKSGQSWVDKEPYKSAGCATGKCARTVSIDGECHYMGDVNYVLYGKLGWLGDVSKNRLYSLIAGWKLVAYQQKPAPGTIGWLYAGKDNWPNGPLTPPSTRPDCGPCPLLYKGKAFRAHVGISPSSGWLQ